MSYENEHQRRRAMGGGGLGCSGLLVLIAGIAALAYALAQHFGSRWWYVAGAIIALTVIFLENLMDLIVRRADVIRNAALSGRDLHLVRRAIRQYQIANLLWFVTWQGRVAAKAYIQSALGLAYALLPKPDVQRAERYLHTTRVLLPRLSFPIFQFHMSSRLGLGYQLLASQAAGLTGSNRLQFVSDALAFYSQAEDIADSFEPLERARLLTGISSYLGDRLWSATPDRVEIEMGIEYAQKALNIYKRFGQTTEQAELLHNLGAMYRYRAIGVTAGNFKQAQKSFKDAIALLESDNLETPPLYRYNLAILLEERTEMEALPEADKKAMLAEALEQLKLIQSDDRAFRRGVLFELANINVLLGKLTGQEVYMTAAVSVLEPLLIDLMRDPSPSLPDYVVEYNLAAALAESNRLDQARNHATHAWDVVRRNSDKWGQLRVRRGQGFIYLRCGQKNEALQAFEEAAQIREQQWEVEATTRAREAITERGYDEMMYRQLVALRHGETHSPINTWQGCQMAKSRNMGSLLAHKLQPPPTVPPELDQQIVSLTGQLQQIRREWTETATLSPGKVEWLSLNEQKLVEELRSTWSQVERTAPEYVEWLKGHPISFQSTKDLLS